MDATLFDLQGYLEHLVDSLHKLEAEFLRRMRRAYRRDDEDTLIELINLIVNAETLLNECYDEVDARWFLAQV